ncbi:hypothetical protein KAT24_00220 [Candidatus Pacearchaeota archaeon]|nr:hypothetical protein [Candidatus Pacearchaeota archaeon]
MSGIFGIKSKRECIDDLLTGIFSLQHRGEDFCGAVTKTKKGLVSYRYEGKVDESFTEKEKKRLTGSYGIGSVHSFYKQPISFESGFGELSLSYSGTILNKRSLRNQLLKRGHSLSIKQTDAEIIGKLITEKNEATNIVEGLKRMANQVKGVYSLGVLAEDGLYAFRSPVGVEPLIVGGNNDISAFSSESCSLKELWLRENEYRAVEPGEIVYIGDKGIETVGQLNGMRALCGFEPGYWERIDSIVDGISVKLMRERAGRILAEEDKKRGFKADIVIPVRDSGVGYCIGYHHGSNLPYDEGLFKNWYVTRTFIQRTKKARVKGADKKQSVIIDAVKDKVVVVLDDSIREGITLRNKLIPLIKWGGAKEIHARIGSPENKFHCRYTVFPKGRGKLLSAGKSLEEQREYIGADSLEFISLEGYVEALDVPSNEVCLGCWTGQFPV